MTVVYEPPLVNPLSGGLYQAAAVIDYDDPSRLAQGVKVHTFNCGGGFGTWDIECAAPANPTKESGGRATDTDFAGDGVWSADECDLRDKQEASDAASQTLKLQERNLVEGKFAARLLADTPTALTLHASTEAEAFVRAVGQLEAAIGYLPGVLHASLHLLAVAQRYGLVINGKTPNGHSWAFGAGYGGLGESLVMTGPVSVHRGVAQVVEGLDVEHNVRLMVAEREVAVTYECFAARVVVPTS